MSTLDYLNSPTAKPGLSFKAAGVQGFSAKLHSAVTKNVNGLGILKNNPAVLDAVNKLALKNQHYIRRGGLSHLQAEKMVHLINHEVAMKGEHLSATEHAMVKKLSHHLSKPVIQKDMSMAGGNIQQSHGITSLSATQHVGSVKQIGDQTKMMSSGDIPHAAGGIANLMKNKNNPISAGGPISSRPTPPRIKLSI